MIPAACHPDRKNYAKGLCKKCYSQAYARSEKEKTRQRARTDNAERARRYRSQNTARVAQSAKQRHASARARDPVSWRVKRLAAKHKRRASCRTSTNLAPTAQQLLDVLKGPCLYCDAPAEEVDHFIPLARGGTHTLCNIVPACKACNRSKGKKLPGVEWFGRPGVAAPT